MSSIKEKIYLSSETALDNKAVDLIVLYLGKINNLVEYCIICSGRSTTHIQTIADKIIERMKQETGASCIIEGYQNARWILMDYQDMIIHIFHEEARRYYALEKLWWNAVSIDHRELAKLTR